MRNNIGLITAINILFLLVMAGTLMCIHGLANITYLEAGLLPAMGEALFIIGQIIIYKSR